MNYMLMQISKDGENWCMYDSKNFPEVIGMAQAILPKDTEYIEVWQTEESVDTYLSASVIFCRNLRTENAFQLFPSIQNDKRTYQIKNVLTGSYLEKEGKRSNEWNRDYTYGKHFSLAVAEKKIKAFASGEVGVYVK